MNKFNLNISGMHCRSCEILVEDSLSKVPEVKKVAVNYKKGAAEIYYSGKKPNLDQLEKAVYEAGYKTGEEERPALFSKNVNDYKDLGVALLALLGVYLILKGLGVTSFDIEAPTDPSNLGVVLLVGLVAGFSTCMALVGGLVLGMSAKHSEKHPEATTKQKFKPHLFFNLGRISGYAVLGGLLGMLGSVFQLSSAATGVMTIFVGAVMLLVGLQLIDIFPRINKIKLTLPKGISKALGINKSEREYSHKNSAIMGALTFFLPCGFTQAMQLYAVSTGNFIQGALIMGMFALGTAPGLLSIAGISSVVKGKTAKRFFKFAGIIVILLALFNFNNGFNLTGWDFSRQSQAATAKNDPNVKLVDGVQVVKMTENNSGYSPNKFTIKKGIPVKWVIDAKAPYSCASSLISSKLGVRKSLKAGQNIIEFTPEETGKIPFSCSMGMYKGAFYVVDDSSKNSDDDIGASEPVVADQESAPSGTCGSSGGCGCGGGKKFVSDESPTTASEDTTGNEQLIQTEYSQNTDISPNAFTAKAGVPIRFEINALEDGVGCMSSIMIPGLVDQPELLTAGQKIVWNFTAEAGEYDITCAMGMKRGTLIVE